jgi:pimeloyl-ACP methyl ester carboxylesterase
LAVVLIALALAINTITVDHETGQAETDIGTLVEVSGTKLQIREDGPRRAPVIVLLHGLAGSMHWWDRAVPLLARGHRVLRLDLLGHGGSDKPRTGYRPDKQAGLIGQVLDRLHVRNALVVGHSLGGMVATPLAEQRPELVRGLVVIGTPPESGYVSLPLAAQLLFRPVIGELLYQTVPDLMVRNGLEAAFAGGVDVPDQFLEDYRKLTYSAYRNSYNEADEFNQAHPLDELAAASGAPLLAISGAQDEEVDPDSLDEWQRVPGARVRLLRGAGHSPQWEKPKFTSRLILSFDRELGLEPR